MLYLALFNILMNMFGLLPESSSLIYSCRDIASNKWSIWP